MQQIEQRAHAQDERIRQLEEILVRQTVGTSTQGNVAEATTEVTTETTTEPSRTPAESTPSITARRPRARLPDPPLFAGNVNDWKT
jgi:hypothetical protein